MHEGRPQWGIMHSWKGIFAPCPYIWMLIQATGKWSVKLFLPSASQCRFVPFQPFWTATLISTDSGSPCIVSVWHVLYRGGQRNWLDVERFVVLTSAFACRLAFSYSTSVCQRQNHVKKRGQSTAISLRTACSSAVGLLVTLHMLIKRNNSFWENALLHFFYIESEMTTLTQTVTTVIYRTNPLKLTNYKVLAYLCTKRKCKNTTSLFNTQVLTDESCIWFNSEVWKFPSWTSELWAGNVPYVNNVKCRQSTWLTARNSAFYGRQQHMNVCVSWASLDKLNKWQSSSHIFYISLVRILHATALQVPFHVAHRLSNVDFSWMLPSDWCQSIYFFMKLAQASHAELSPQKPFHHTFFRKLGWRILVLSLQRSIIS